MLTEAEWLTRTDPLEMIKVFSLVEPSAKFKISERKGRLLCCVWHNISGCTAYSEEDCLRGERAPLGELMAHMTRCSRNSSLQHGQAEKVAVFRDIVGNPFRPVRLWHAHGAEPRGDSFIWVDARNFLTWNNKTVSRMAHTIYEEHRFEDLPILADALEEAGCQELVCCPRNCWLLSGVRVYSEDGKSHSTAPAHRCDCKDGWIENPLLTHLRSAGPHVRGCWALDLLLGKE